MSYRLFRLAQRQTFRNLGRTDRTDQNSSFPLFFLARVYIQIGRVLGEGGVEHYHEKDLRDQRRAVEAILNNAWVEFAEGSITKACDRLLSHWKKATPLGCTNPKSHATHEIQLNRTRFLYTH